VNPPPQKKSAKSKYSSYKLIRLAYSRNSFISANTIGFGEGDTLQKIRNALLIRQEIAYKLSCSKRKRK
jgi:hypothetical protein